MNKGHYNNQNKIFINYFQKVLTKSGPIMSASYSLFFIVILFSIIGYYLDKTFHSFPIVFLLLLFFGLLVGLYQLYKVVKTDSK